MQPAAYANGIANHATSVQGGVATPAVARAPAPGRPLQVPAANLDRSTDRDQTARSGDSDDRDSDSERSTMDRPLRDDGDDSPSNAAPTPSTSAPAAGAAVDAQQRFWASYEGDMPVLSEPVALPVPNAATPAGVVRTPIESLPVANDEDALAAGATAGTVSDAAANEPQPLTSGPERGEANAMVQILPIDPAALEAGMRRLFDALATSAEALRAHPYSASLSLWICLLGAGAAAAEVFRRQWACSAAQAAQMFDADRSSGMRYRPADRTS
jgi:hypothetical protein